MAARQPVATLVSPTDLRACTGAAEVLELFRKLRYPVEPRPVAVPIEYGELPESLRAGIAQRYLVAQLGGTVPGEPSLDVTLFVLSDAEHKSALVRGIAANWTRRYPGNHLLIFAVPDATAANGFDQLTFVNTERLGEGAQVRVKLRKLIVERSHPTRHDADTVSRIALASPTVSADTAYKAQIEAFNVERMTDTFYRGYAELFRKAIERIRDDNKGIQDFYDASKLHSFTQRLFGRVMFLYFLQKKRSLDGNLNFIAQQYDEAVRHNENFYLSVLEPLFFDTLNRQRPNQMSPKFGRVPYLNGGLFAEDELDHRGAVLLDNELFDTKSEDGILYFLNNHNFTIEEDTPLEVEVALDPEMLGKVFENLLEAEERGKSGTFYTPRPVVAFMCREALAAYLTRETTIPADLLGWLLDEAETGEPARDDAGNPRLTHHTLPRHTREQIERALESIRVLDPAVGSGAFPLGMLALLVGTRRALYRIAEVQIAPSSQLVEGWKRNFIRDCLYGVDIKREAIEIARLRLWLSLVVDADPFDMEPLPNLDYKLMVGDSLIETFDGVEIYPTRPKSQKVQQNALMASNTQLLIRELHDLQSYYFQPDGGQSRSELKHKIDATEADIVRAALRERREAEAIQLDSLNQRMAKFAAGAVPAALNAESADLSRRIDRTDEALKAINTGQPLPFFLYRLHFAPVFEEKDGFDIVIANPPYVSIEHMAADYKEVLKRTYPEVAAGRADLYVYFYARGLQLQHDGGTLAYISSNKFFRSAYGQSLRNLLSTYSAGNLVIDFGDFPVFDAAAYPCIVITRKDKPNTDHTYRGLTAANDIQLDKLALTVAENGQNLTQRDGLRPPTGTSATAALTNRLMRLGMPLGHLVHHQMYRGVVTGLNAAFLIHQGVRDWIVAKDPRCASVLRPVLRGRDVNRYSIESNGLWLIYTYHGIDIRGYPTIEEYLGQFRSQLEARATVQPWYELQQPQMAYQAEFQRPKIVYPDIAPHAKFSYDPSGSFAEATLFCIPSAGKFLTAVLNSILMDFLFMHISPSIRGGFYRYKNAYTENLPVVTPQPTEQKRLSELVDKLQALGGKGPEAEAYEREVDEIVYRTYGLTSDEIKIIEDWHAERRAMLGNGKRGKRTAMPEPDEDSYDEDREEEA